MARSCVEVGILDRDRRQEMVADDLFRSRAGTTDRGGPQGGTIGSPARGAAGWQGLACRSVSAGRQI